MLPLEPFLFMPAVPIAIVFLIGLFFCDRSTERYRRFWLITFTIALLLSVSYFVSVMGTSFYSQRPHGPANPGGASTGVGMVVVTYLLGTCIVLPAFPVLVLLGIFSPKSYGRKKRITIVSIATLGVVLLTSMIFMKHRAYTEDYQEYKKALRQKPKQTPFERFKHLREKKEDAPEDNAAVRAKVFQEIVYTNRFEVLALLLSKEVLKSLKEYTTSGRNNLRERDAQASDQDFKVSLFQAHGMTLQHSKIEEFNGGRNLAKRV